MSAGKKSEWGPVGFGLRSREISERSLFKKIHCFFPLTFFCVLFFNVVFPSKVAAADPIAGLNPVFSTAVSTASGFKFSVTNYNSNYIFTPSVTFGTITAGTPSGNILPLHVTGISPGSSATVTVTTSRLGYTSENRQLTASSLGAAPVATFSSPISTPDGYVVNITNIDSNFVFTTITNAGVVTADIANGSIQTLTVSGLAPGADATISVTTTRTGFTSGVSDLKFSSLPPRLIWSTRDSAAELSWQSVVYGNGIFVAVGRSGTGNRVMTSPDGITWTSRASASDNEWSSVTFGNNTFVAVAQSGTGDRVMTSPDGITWTSRASASDNEWSSVTFGNNTFVAVSSIGTGNRVMTSPDGITWTGRQAAASNSWQSVTFGNNLFVAVSYSGTRNRSMVSSDGITWALGSTNTMDLAWYGVTYGNGIFVAVAASGTGNRVMTSTNGISWTSRKSAGDIPWWSVTFGNGLFVAVADYQSQSAVMTSPDGVTWTTGPPAFSSRWKNVTYGNGTFVAVSSFGTANRVMTSPDGITPYLGLPRSTPDGFIVDVQNYDPNFTFEFSSSAGTLTTGDPVGNILSLRLTGLSSGESATVNITSRRTNFSTVSIQVTGSSLQSPNVPAISSPLSTAGGFNFNVLNYDSNFTYLTSTTKGRVVVGAASGNTLPITVLGMSLLESATVTVQTSRDGYNSGRLDISSQPIEDLINPISSSRQSKIVFVSDRNFNSEIYLMGSDGLNQTRLTTEIESDFRPHFLPDGKISFHSNRSGGGSDVIFVMNPDGSGLENRSASIGRADTPKWSPDGTRISFAYQYCCGGSPGYEIVVMDADGQNRTRVTSNNFYDREPSWSPDGQYLVYTSSQVTDGIENSEIMLMRFDGSNQVNITNSISNEKNPTWSPDGTRILYSSDGSGNFEIYSMKTDGSNAIQLTSNLATDQSPSWSPDGSQIVFLSMRGGRGQIYLANADGTNEINLSNNNYWEEEPSWGLSPAALIPTFTTAIATSDGFMVSISNYNSDYLFTPTVTSGSISAGSPSNSTLPLTVTGLSAGDSATVTVATTRSGYSSGSGQITASAMIRPALTPTFGTAIPTLDGFTLQITNYDTNYQWSANNSESTSVIISNTGLITVSGLPPATTSRVTVTTARIGYAVGRATSLEITSNAAPSPAPSPAPAPAPASGGGGGGGVGTTWFNLFVSNPDEPMQAYAGEACAFFIHKLADGDKQFGPICASKSGALDFEANDGDFLIRVYDKAFQKDFKEYKAKIKFGTFEVVGAGYRGGSVARRVITVLKASERAPEVIATPTPSPTPSPMPASSATPSPTATPSNSPSPTPKPVLNMKNNGSVLITKKTASTKSVSLTLSNSKLSIRKNASISISIPKSASPAAVRVNLMIPSGDVLTVASVASFKGKIYSTPVLGFKKAGTYLITFSVGKTVRTLTVKVS